VGRALDEPRSSRAKSRDARRAQVSRLRSTRTGGVVRPNSSLRAKRGNPVTMVELDCRASLAMTIPLSGAYPLTRPRSPCWQDRRRIRDHRGYNEKNYTRYSSFYLQVSRLLLFRQHVAILLQEPKQVSVPELKLEQCAFRQGTQISKLLSY
jgi:hypothetical protein